MKLRNKETGQIFDTIQPVLGGEGSSIAELLEKWEDYDDTKDHWCISFCGEAKRIGKYANSDDIARCKQIGNYFETEEEAGKAVEKLKAWKRLKDLGFKCSYHSSGYHRGTFTADFIFDEDKLPIMDTFAAKDLNLLFGGEE